MKAQINNQELKVVAQGIYKRLKELQESKEWEKNGDKPCQMYKMGIDARVASKGVAIVHAPLQAIVEFLDKEDTLQKLNNQLIQIKVLHEVKDVFRVNYMQYKGIWPVANRDFVNVGAKTVETAGKKVYIGTKACNFPYPEVKDVVRGEVFIGGYIIEAIDENTTRVTYISDADLKGSIPGMIKNTLSKKQGEIASRVEKHLLQSLKK